MWRHDLPESGEVGARHVVEVLDSIGRVYGRGELIACTERPIITLQRDDGSKFTWIAALGWRIVPQPKVGDVVTADMDLPYQSIIEASREDLAFRTNCTQHGYPCWNHGGDHEKLDWLLNTDDWRIVRIGGTS